MRKLPANPTIEDLTKEELIHLVRFVLMIRPPSPRDLAYLIWELESKRTLAEMGKVNDESHRLTEASAAAARQFNNERTIESLEKHQKARDAWTRNQKRFDELSKETNRLSKYIEKWRNVKEEVRR